MLTRDDRKWLCKLMMLVVKVLIHHTNKDSQQVRMWRDGGAAQFMDELDELIDSK